jgi:hypothetical protein
MQGSNGPLKVWTQPFAFVLQPFRAAFPLSLSADAQHWLQTAAPVPSRHRPA